MIRTTALRNIYHLSAIVFMVVMLGLLVDRYYLRGQGEELSVDPESLGEVESETSWYGIYMRGEKIGYSRSTVSSQDTVLICTDQTYLSFNMIGENKSVTTFSRAVTNDRMELVSFIFTVNGPDTDYGVRGRVDGTVLNLNINTGGESRGDRIELDEPVQLPSTVQLMIEGRELEPGDRFSTTIFDPGSMSDIELLVEVVGYETREYGGRRVEVLHLRQDMGGMQVDSYLDSLGTMLEESSGMGYRLVLEDEETARNGNWSERGTDIQRLVSVEPDRAIRGARALTSLKLEISGIGSDTLDLRGGCQRYDENTHVLEIDISMPAAEALEDTVPSVVRDVYTSPGPFIQSEHPRLLDLTARVVDLSADAPRKIRSILGWLRGNMETKPTFSIPNTLEVLERRSGDCNEFAVLFTSMARASGIPTRVAMGLVYVEDAFYYHAWAECWLGGWVPVDPVFDQFPADATHIRFLAGDMDRQTEILPLIGKVGVKVLGQGGESGAGR